MSPMSQLLFAFSRFWPLLGEWRCLHADLHILIVSKPSVRKQKPGLSLLDQCCTGCTTCQIHPDSSRSSFGVSPKLPETEKSALQLPSHSCFKSWQHHAPICSWKHLPERPKHRKNHGKSCFKAKTTDFTLLKTVLSGLYG